jgi:nucleoside-diphosphate-sugar epimerase
LRFVVTGAGGQIGRPLAEHLARSHDVVAVARFGDEAVRARLEVAGVRTVPADLGAGAFDGVPPDPDFVVHLAAYMARGEDFDAALRVNAEGTGLLLQHCRRAGAALVMSTQSVYRPSPDPHHAFVETDPLGEVNAGHSPTYSMSKIGEEAVARYCARAFDLPVTIARMNASYGPGGGLPAYQMDAVAEGRPVTVRHDPSPYSPIHQDDINAQVEALLGAASVPATIVNWAGDEVVTVQQWCSLAGELAGVVPEVVVKEKPGTPTGQVADVGRRISLTGPCRISWREGMSAVFEARRAVGRGE